MHKLTIEEMHRLNVAEYKESEKLPLVLVLDNIRSFHNVGSFFRTADAFRIGQIFLCGITGCPPSPEIHKTALGAEDSVDWEYFPDVLDAFQQLRTEGYTILAAEQVEGSMKLNEVQLEKGKKYAVVFGHEVHGVSQSAVDACDGALEIPQYGTKHSLNVSVTGGIVVFEFFRQIGK